jgi:hypothetical protein
MITEEGRGLLVDWDLCKILNAPGVRLPERTVWVTIFTFHSFIHDLSIGNLAIHGCSAHPPK